MKKQNQIKHYKLMPHCKSSWPLSIAYYAPFPGWEPLHDHAGHLCMTMTVMKS